MTAAARTLAVVALACIGALAVALLTQHAFDMQPCPWCVLQRLIFVAIALACGLGLAWRSAAGLRVGRYYRFFIAGNSELYRALWSATPANNRRQIRTGPAAS